MLQYHFKWKMLSAMAGVSWGNFYFRLFPASICSSLVQHHVSFELER